MATPWWIQEQNTGDASVYRTADGTYVQPDGQGGWVTAPPPNAFGGTFGGGLGFGDQQQYGQPVAAPVAAPAAPGANFVPAETAQTGLNYGQGLFAGAAPTALAQQTGNNVLTTSANQGALSLTPAIQGGQPGYTLPATGTSTASYTPVSGDTGLGGSLSGLFADINPVAAALTLGVPFAAGALTGAIGGGTAGTAGAADAAWGVNPAASGLVEDFATPELLRAGQGVLSGLPAAAVGGAAAGAGLGVPSLSTVATGAGLASSAAGLGGGSGGMTAQGDDPSGLVNDVGMLPRPGDAEYDPYDDYGNGANDRTDQYPIDPNTGLPSVPTPGTGGTAAAQSALQRILAGSGTPADFASAFGSIAPGLLGAFGSSQQADALRETSAAQGAREDARYADLVRRESERFGVLTGREDANIAKADKLRADAQAVGAPYRSQLQSLSADPSSFLASPEVRIPVDQGTSAVARALSTGGNPTGSGRALTEIQNYASGQLFGKLGQEKDRLASYGGLSSYNAAGASIPGITTTLPTTTSAGSNVGTQAGAQAGQAAIGADSNIYNSLGYGLNNLMNPQQSLSQLLQSLNIRAPG